MPGALIYYLCIHGWKKEVKGDGEVKKQDDWKDQDVQEEDELG